MGSIRVHLDEYELYIMWHGRSVAQLPVLNLTLVSEESSERVN